MKNTPAYLTIYHYIKKKIIEEQFPYGAKLPSKRQLALDFDVSVITTEHAYELLEEEGYIATRPRSGYFVIYQSDTNFMGTTNASLTSPTNTSGQPSIQPHAHNEMLSDKMRFSYNTLAKTYRKVLTDTPEEILFTKCPPKGLYELRSEIASYLYRNRGIHVSPEQILIGSGAEYLYGMIIQMLGRRKIYAHELPCYETIEKVYLANGAKVRGLQMGPDGIDSDALRTTDADVLHVTPYKSYPSNITASVTKRNEYLKWAKQHDHIIIEDDYNSEFTLMRKAEDTLFSLEPEHHVIYLNTFSLTLSRGLRVGYLILPNQEYEQLFRQIDFYSCSVSVLDQLFLAELLRSGDFERHINRVRRILRRELQPNPII